MAKCRNGSGPPSIHRPKAYDAETHYEAAMRYIARTLPPQPTPTEKDASRQREERQLKRASQVGDDWRRGHA